MSENVISEEQFVLGYIEAVEFMDEVNLDYDAAEAACSSFLTKNSELLAQFIVEAEVGEETCAVLFHGSRNGHGVGYWEYEYPSAKALDRAAKAEGETHFDLELEDDDA